MLKLYSIFHVLTRGKNMISYDSLWKIMKTKEMTKMELRKAANLSTSTFAKLGKNEIVSLDVLVRICKVLHCQLNDVCKIIF